jgi:hypothetical protein
MEAPPGDALDTAEATLDIIVLTCTTTGDLVDGTVILDP